MMKLNELKVNDKIQITIYDGPSGEAIVQSVNDDGVVIKWLNYTMCYPHTSLASEITEIANEDVEVYDIIAELELLERTDNKMYCIIKTDVLCGAGGESVSVRIHNKSKDKSKLEQYLYEKLIDALNNDEVEFINYEERSEIQNAEDVRLTNELYIQYEGDGWDWESERYNIVLDENVETL